jgi:hypothetical protein
LWANFPPNAILKGVTPGIYTEVDGRFIRGYTKFVGVLTKCTNKIANCEGGQTVVGGKSHAAARIE